MTWPHPCCRGIHPITVFSGGIGDNDVFEEGYTGSDFAGNPYGVLNIATTAAGTDFSELSLFAPYNAYFITRRSMVLRSQFRMEHSISMCFPTRRRRSSDRGKTVARAKATRWRTLQCHP